MSTGEQTTDGRRAGERVGAYRLLRRLGQGGMGEAWLCETGARGLERLCVLKLMRTDTAALADASGRFLDEARLAIHLTHPGICHTFDVGMEGDTTYIAMEHISGVSLRELLGELSRAGRGVPEPLAAHIASEVLDALDYAHRLRHPITGAALHVVHRDVSPHNVMLSFEGDVKLIDFGLAASALKQEKTESQVVIGKLAYMAPEQARGEPVTAGVDQFAAGVMLYEMLAGERYYGSRPQSEVWAVVGVGSFRPARLSTLHPALRALLERALAPHAQLRFASCADMSDALRSYVLDTSLPASRVYLRELMQELYAERIELERARLSELVRGGLAGPATQTVPMVVDEPAVEAVAEPITEPTQATEVMPRSESMALAAGPSSRGRLALAAGLGAVLTLAAVLAVASRSSPEADVTPPPAPAASLAAETVEPTAPIAQKVAPVDVLPGRLNTSPTPASPPPDAGVVSVEKPREKITSPPRRRGKGPGRKHVASPPPTTTTTTTTAERVAKMTRAQKMAVIGWCKLSCAGSLRSVKAAGSDVSDAALDVCVEQCLR